MAKQGKKYVQAKALVKAGEVYALADAVTLTKKLSYTKFVGSLEVHAKTFADPKYNDQMMRGTVVLPHGTGKKIIIAAFVGEDLKKAAQQAGADIVGSDDLIKEIEAGTVTFDVLVTTPDMMRDLAKVAKILGPKGLMPSPKSGTVSPNIENAIDEIKKGRVEFKLDKTGNVHVAVGKLSFTDEQLAENTTALLKALVEHKPTGIKAKLLKKVVIAPTMGPGVQIVVTVE